MPQDAGSLPSGVPAVLFVCEGNTCRSVMAEALTRRRFGKNVDVSSAGLRPQRPADARNAIDTLKAEFGLDASGHVSRDVRSLNLAAYDHIIAMDKHVAKTLKTLPSREFLVWQIEDPDGYDLSVYRQCALRINQNVARLPFAATLA